LILTGQAIGILKGLNIMAMQMTPRRDSSKQAATARRLLSNCPVAPHVKNSTLSVEEFPYLNTEKPVALYRTREEGLICGKVVVMPHQQFFAVRSLKWSDRYYVVAWNERIQRWQCSAEDDITRRRCMEAAFEYREALRKQAVLVAA
jgi:hypothetical protein